MAPLNPGQLRTRERVEAIIRLAAPALDLVLNVGDRVSRTIEPDDLEYYPPQAARPAAANRPAPDGAGD